jgi:hypothetical protein
MATFPPMGPQIVFNLQPLIERGILAASGAGGFGSAALGGAAAAGGGAGAGGSALYHGGELGQIERSVPDGPSKVFCGGLPYSMSDKDIVELLQAFGKLRGFHLVRDAAAAAAPGALHKGYCFFSYFDDANADAAVKGLHGLSLTPGLTPSHTLTVRRASTRDGGGGGAGGAGGGAGGAAVAAAAFGGFGDASALSAAMLQQQILLATGARPGAGMGMLSALMPQMPQMPVMPQMPGMMAPMPGMMGGLVGFPFMPGMPQMPAPQLPPQLPPQVPQAAAAPPAAAVGGAGAGAGAGGASAGAAAAPTRSLRLLNLPVSDDDLRTREGFDTLYDEMREEMARHGRVERLVIPREGPARGEVLVQYAELADAARAMATLAGRSFAGVVVRCTYVQDGALADVAARAPPRPQAWGPGPG